MESESDEIFIHLTQIPGRRCRPGCRSGRQTPPAPPGGSGYGWVVTPLPITTTNDITLISKMNIPPHLRISEIDLRNGNSNKLQIFLVSMLHSSSVVVMTLLSCVKGVGFDSVAMRCVRPSYI